MKYFGLITLLSIALAGCASQPKTQSSTPAIALADANSLTLADSDASDFDLIEDQLPNKPVISDPIAPWNRLMYHVNDGLYFWILKPVAQGYKAIIPEPGRIGVSNFFQNVTTPVRLVNCLLQGKGQSAGTELKRFGINTTVGVLGFGDPARDRWKIDVVNEDLGQTLAEYGLGDGVYIVWPFFGPSTARDSVGLVGDMFLNPVFYVEPMEARIGVSAVNVTNKTSLHIGEYEAFKSAAIDPYIAMRDAYIQYRQKQIDRQQTKQN